MKQRKENLRNTELKEDNVFSLFPGVMATRESLHLGELETAMKSFVFRFVFPRVSHAPKIQFVLTINRKHVLQSMTCENFLHGTFLFLFQVGMISSSH